MGTYFSYFPLEISNILPSDCLPLAGKIYFYNHLELYAQFSGFQIRNGQGLVI
jgi:hypothetical protein